MSTAIDERTDLEIIESLDFEHVPACELRRHSTGVLGHSGPAWALIRIRTCPCCGRAGMVRYVCKGRWDNGAKGGMYCPGCGLRGPRDFWWTLVSLVNG